MKPQIVEQVEFFSEAELESLEFVPEELEAIEAERVPDLDSISFEDIAKDLEAYFEGGVEQARLERGTILNIQEILTAHNKYRSQVGVSPLKWSATVAKSAQQWANRLAATGKFEHSKNRRGYGENLWMGTSRRFSCTQMVDSWGKEKKYFVNRPSPNFSKTGKFSDVGHYTQVVWRKTTEVGCALVSRRGKDYLVCQYNPAGNVKGQKAF